MVKKTKEEAEMQSLNEILNDCLEVLKEIRDK